MKNFSGFFPAIAAAVFLLLAVSSHWPYFFYVLLHLTVCAIALYLALDAFVTARQLWVWVFGAVAVLFNPLIPVRMHRSDWSSFDIIAASVFALWVISSLVREKPGPRLRATNVSHAADPVAPAVSQASVKCTTQTLYLSQNKIPRSESVMSLYGLKSLEIVRELTPEEEELAAKLEELARLKAELTERELNLAGLKAELAAFEGLYLRRVGALYAELDEWNARLAELRAEQANTSEARAEAAEARSQAQESYSAAHGEAAKVQPFTPSPDLKSLYREAAKRAHPDTAADETDRMRRERVMKEVNAAYAAGDEDALRRILADLENSPDVVQGSDIGAALIRVIRQLKQIRHRIAMIEQEVSSLLNSDLGKLKKKADAASTEGRNLLEEMAAELRGRVSIAQQEFEKMSKAKVHK